MPLFINKTLKYGILIKYSKIPCKFTIKTQKKKSLYLLEFLHKKSVQMRPKKIMTKHRMFDAPNLRKSKKNYQPLVVKLTHLECLPVGN